MRTHLVTAPHGSREDPFYWLRDDTRSDPEVLAYLRAETAYADHALAPSQALIDKVYGEIIGRIKEDDSSVPVRYRGYWYSSRFVSGAQYPVIVRLADAAQAPEAVLLDCNALAAGQPFFQLGGYEASPDNTLLAYAEDTIGRRQFRIRFKDIASGELLGDVIENAEPDVAWADDDRTLLYVEKDPVTLLGRRVRAHVLGTPVSADRLVYEEPDESFDLVVMRSKSDRHLYIGSESTTTSEWRYARAGDPSLRFAVVVPRTADHEYQVEDLDERMLIRTNWLAQNFRVVVAPLEHCGDRAQWRDVLPHDPEVFVQSMDVFREFLAVNERSAGLLRIRVRRWNGETFHIAADDPTYTMLLGSNPELETTVLRYVYTSLTTPATTYDYDVSSGERQLRKREPVLGDFDPSRYASELLWAPARDGELVPVSVVYRKDTAIDGTAPLYQYAYGSYGLSADPAFSSARLSLLDRGFVYAIAHIRGGQERGRRWYDAGRLQHKWNTFNDFVDVTDHLVARGYGARGRVFAAGGSAGGLLMGVIANVAPEKYRALIAHVPFVDIVTTMLDESIPLTTLEYQEWGDPHEPQDYRYMLSYSPYDNVHAQAYPAMLVTTGLWDSQVQYYEPAKWMAKLRRSNTGNQPLLLHVNFEAGHGGKSGRYERMREVAREYGFIISLGGNS
ncbi:MAG TPA: S9 family peptidase [Steroidobacteraceae bacterium]|nr:S9 family peptidase [Steroidobacteraceae bacterium]